MTILDFMDMACSINGNALWIVNGIWCIICQLSIGCESKEIDFLENSDRMLALFSTLHLILSVRKMYKSAIAMVS